MAGTTNTGRYGMQAGGTLHDAFEADPDSQALEVAIRELLIEKGVFSAADVQRMMEDTESRTPMLGAKIVARAWVDPAYKERLFAGGKRAVEELGIDTFGWPELGVVENTERLHHVVVCTLCSCYPKVLLGIPPAWYKQREYRARCVSEPRAVLKEFGTDLPGAVEVRVVDSTADLRYLVIPKRPAGTEGWTEDRLATLVSRDSMIGVTAARNP